MCEVNNLDLSDLCVIKIYVDLIRHGMDIPQKQAKFTKLAKTTDNRTRPNTGISSDLLNFQFCVVFAVLLVFALSPVSAKYLYPLDKINF